jgi:S-adenosylmethionine hydrolase
VAAPFITLTTDFGSRDPYVGIMKSRILQRLADARLIDLSHDITPFRPEEAGFWLWRSAPQFPPGTVHVGVVDPGVGTARALLAVRAGGQLFLAPDNGLLGLVCQAHADAEVLRIERQALARAGITAVSATFHGRDILAPLAAELAAERCRFEQLGAAATPESGRLARAARGKAGEVVGAIAAVDRYGNLLTTVEAGTLGHLRQPVVTLAGRDFPLVATYGAARNGAYVALVNSFGTLEVACVCGNAAEGLSAQWGATVSVHETQAELNGGVNQL